MKTKSEIKIFHFFIKYVKEKVKKFQHGYLSGLVGICASIHQTIKYKSFVRIYMDHEGHWHNCRKEATFVAPSLNAVCYREVEDYVLNGWCYDYMPTVGDTIIDIGAGIGDDVIVFSRLVGVNGLVVAIEAHPTTFKCLLKTIEINKLNNVISLNVATGDRKEYVQMGSEESYLENRIIKKSKNTVNAVKCDKLDEILSDLKIINIDLLKANIEGAETATLKGANKTLMNTRNIVISCHDFIADNGGDASFRTYEECKIILQKSNFKLIEPREKTKPWFPYYLHGKNVKFLSNNI